MTVHGLLFTRHFLFRRAFTLWDRRGEGVGVPVPEGRYSHLLLAGWGILFFSQASSACRPAPRRLGDAGASGRVSTPSSAPVQQVLGEHRAEEVVGGIWFFTPSILAGGFRKSEAQAPLGRMGSGLPTSKSAIRNEERKSLCGNRLRITHHVSRPSCQRADPGFAIARRAG